MKTHALLTLLCLSCLTPMLVAQTEVMAPPTIPEEARKHFVMGTALFADAKSPADFVQVENEFKQATDLAPQWPDARYNLALAKEASGDYSGAMADLKLYQQFKLSDTDARKVQDKIYVLEAKQQKKAAEQKALDDANRPEAQSEKLVQSLDGGVWRCVGSTIDDRVMGHRVDLDVGRAYIAVSGHMISGYEGGTYHKDIPLWTEPITSRRFNATWSGEIFYPGALDRYSDEFTISDDGRSIIESRKVTSHDTGGSYDFIQKRNYTRDR